MDLNSFWHPWHQFYFHFLIINQALKSLSELNCDFSVSTKNICLRISTQLQAATFTMTLPSSWNRDHYSTDKICSDKRTISSNHLNLSTQGPQRNQTSLPLTSLEASQLPAYFIQKRSEGKEKHRERLEVDRALMDWKMDWAVICK